MPAVGGTQLTTSSGKYFWQADIITSLLRVYSSRMCMTQSRYPAWPQCSSRSLYKIIWENPLGLWTETSWYLMNRSTNSSEHVAQPHLEPGAMTLEKES